MPRLAPIAAPEGFSRRVAVITNKTPVAWFALTQSGGYTPALRLVVHFSDDSTAFVKAATTDLTTEWLRAERKVYERLAGKLFLPGYLGADDGAADGEFPLLVLEDLTQCEWPPPWSTEKIQRVLEAYDLVRAAGADIPLGDLPRVEDQIKNLACWQYVAADPGPFLSLGFCSRDWLDNALPALLAAQDAAPVRGDDLLHLDVRSDNLCFRPTGHAVLIDWNIACWGNGAFDIAGWLPSLHWEGGPPPETVSEEAGRFAALLAGFWAYRAGQPPVPLAPRVRDVQKQQLTTALPWAARVLGLLAPDGQK